MISVRDSRFSTFYAGVGAICRSWREMQINFTKKIQLDCIKTVRLRPWRFVWRWHDVLLMLCNKGRKCSTLDEYCILCMCQAASDKAHDAMVNGTCVHGLNSDKEMNSLRHRHPLWYPPTSCVIHLCNIRSSDQWGAKVGATVMALLSVLTPVLALVLCLVIGYMLVKSWDAKTTSSRSPGQAAKVDSRPWVDQDLQDDTERTEREDGKGTNGLKLFFLWPD